MADTAQGSEMGDKPSARAGRAGPKPIGQRKKKAKGKSQILNKLATQLKFYFSDSNLWKDKFLRQKMDESEDGYISIGLLASFRKMLSLTRDVNMVVHAAKMCSPLLDVSKDGKYVRRSMPLPQAPDDIDQRTLYIEKLPSNVDHEMMKRCFGAFGAVTHVSLPKFKKKSTVKGFAFVEFSERTSVEDVLSYFAEEAAHGDENEQAVSTSAETTGSTDCVTTCAGAADRHAEAPSSSSGSALSGREGTSAMEDSSFVKSRKRPHSDIESDAEERKSRKRPHSDIESVSELDKNPSQGSTQEQEDHGCVASSKKAKTKSVTERNAGQAAAATTASGEKSPAASISSEAMKRGGSPDNEKAKKRTRSHWKKKSQRKLIKEAFGDWKPSIMPKTQWQELKEEYKSLVRQQTLAAKEYYRSQREALCELSEHQDKPKVCARMDETLSMGDSVSDSDSADCAGSTTADDSAFEQAMNSSASLATAASTSAAAAAAAAAAGPSGASELSADFVPGTVISVDWADSVNTEPWTAVLLKRSLVELSSLEFVDFKPGEHSAYLRCASADKTANLLRKLTANSDSRKGSMCRPSRAVLLCGEEERLYWQRLAENRKKTHEERGGRCRRSRDRLAGQVKHLAAVQKKKADPKHIVFSDEDVDVTLDDITM